MNGDWRDYDGTEGGERWRRAERRGGDEEEGEADLCRTVQDAPDEVDQLLHGADGLAGQEVLLVGGVEDDHGGHRHFSEGGGGDAGLHRAFGLASLDRNTLQTTVVNKAFGL